MKSSEETRKRFKERITEALGVVADSDELTEALGIVEDLDELMEIQAITAEYFYHSNLTRVEDYYDDYDDYDDYGTVHDGVVVKKLKEYVVHRMDLFLGVGVHGGVWKNSQHWIAVQVDKLRQAAEKAGMSFMKDKIKRPAAPAPSPYTNPFTHPKIGQINLTPPKPAAPVSQYLDEMKEIVDKLTSSHPSLVSVTLKTCGDFEIKYGGKTCYLCHSYVPRTVTVKDSGRKKVRVFKETDINGIVQCLKGVLS